MVEVEKEKGENRKEGEKCEVVESSISKELSHSPMHVKKKDYFLINCFQKIILQHGRRKIHSLMELEGRYVVLNKNRGGSWKQFFEAKRLVKGSFTIFVSTGDLFVGDALLDLGSIFYKFDAINHVKTDR